MSGAFQRRPLSAARHNTAKCLFHLPEIRDLGPHLVQVLCSEPKSIGAAAITGIVGKSEECPDLIEAEAKLSCAANEAQPLQVRRAVEPMLSGGPRRGTKYACPFIETDPLDGQAGVRGQCTDRQQRCGFVRFLAHRKKSS
jgi:hypothetical protein